MKASVRIPLEVLRQMEELARKNDGWFAGYATWERGAEWTVHSGNVAPQEWTDRVRIYPMANTFPAGLIPVPTKAGHFTVIMERGNQKITQYLKPTMKQAFLDELTEDGFKYHELLTYKVGMVELRRKR